MAALVYEASKTPGPAQRAALLTIKEFLLPFDISGEASLMARSVEHLSASMSEQRTIDEVRNLVDRVRLDARPPARQTWLRGLKEGADNVGLPEGSVEANVDETGEPADITYSSKHLRLRDGADPLNFEAVQTRAKSVAAIGELLEHEDDASFFDWVPLAAEMVQNESNEKALIELAALFNNNRRFSQILTAVSLRLGALRYHAAAWDIGKEALEMAGEYDWHPRFGGGSKIAAVRALCNVDRGRAVTLAYESLVSDLQNTEGLIGSIPELMEDLLALLDPSVAVQDVWGEIEVHTSELLGENGSTAPWGLFEGEITVDNPHRSVVELIAEHLGHPCFPVVQAAQRCLGQLLLERSDYVADALFAALEQSVERQERALMVIDAVSSVDSEVVNEFWDAVCRLGCVDISP